MNRFGPLSLWIYRNKKKRNKKLFVPLFSLDFLLKRRHLSENHLRAPSCTKFLLYFVRPLNTFHYFRKFTLKPGRIGVHWLLKDFSSCYSRFTNLEIDQRRDLKQLKSIFFFLHFPISLNLK